MTNTESWDAAASVELVQRCYGHIEQGQWEQANALLAENFTFNEPPSLDYGGQWHGRDAMQRLFTFLMSYWSEPDIKVNHMIGDDKYCIVLMTFSAKGKKTGERFSQDVVEVLHIADGRITDLYVHYFDTAQLALDTGSIARLTKASEQA